MKLTDKQLSVILDVLGVVEAGAMFGEPDTDLPDVTLTDVAQLKAKIHDEQARRARRAKAAVDAS